jgi:ribosomal protein L13E
MSTMPAGKIASSIACGDSHTAVLMTDGTIFCCGTNVSGQLGDGTTARRSSLTLMSTMPAGKIASSIACGAFHTALLMTDGTIFCCGSNSNGRLGDGTTTSRSSLTLMINIPANKTLKTIACGGYHTAVLMTDGTIYCCGFNGSGQLGDGTTTSRSSLTLMSTMPAGKIASSIACGSSHTAVLMTDGTIFCCGSITGNIGVSTSKTLQIVNFPNIYIIYTLKNANANKSTYNSYDLFAGDLKAVGFTLAELKTAEFTLAELKTAEFTLAELKAAGFTATELKAAGYTATELKIAGFTLAELKVAGFTATELKIAGFTLAELKVAGFTATELKNAGFTATELKNAGFTLTELKNAGFTATELKNAGFTLAELTNAGYNATELTSAGFSTTDIFNNFGFISNVCFLAGTPVSTNQGNIAIEKINPNVHTIRNKKIVGVTKTITQDKYLVCFEKDALDINIPSQKTIISKEHKILYKGKLIKAKEFINKFDNVYKLKYNGEILYNILMEKYDKMIINNLICETLHPENTAAQLCKILQTLNAEQQELLIKQSNELVIKNKVYSSKK